MRVVGIHPLPWDEAAYLKEVELYGADFGEQFEVTRKNAWLVVIEPEEDFDILEVALSEGPNQDPQNMQVPWLEEALSDGTMAFYLHYVGPHSALHYKGMPVAMPPASPAPAWILKAAPYACPD